MKQIHPYFLSLFLILGNFGFAQTDANAPIHGITIYIDYPDAPAMVTGDQI